MAGQFVDLPRRWRLAPGRRPYIIEILHTTPRHYFAAIVASGYHDYSHRALPNDNIIYVLLSRHLT